MAEAFRVPRSEIERRTNAIQQELRRAEIDGLFIVQRADLFYFSGTAQNGFLYLPVEGRPLLFVKQSVARARAESALEVVVPIDTIKAVPGLIADACGRTPGRLGLELDVLPVNEFRFYRNLFKPKDCLDGSPLILRVRSIKSAWEIAQLEATAEMTRRTFDYMRTIIARGRDIPIEAGMVFAIEPKMVYENEFAAGVESVFQVTPNGGGLISKVPSEIFIC